MKDRVTDWTETIKITGRTKDKGDNVMDLKKTGKFISDLRKERGLTQKELADQVGVTDKAVSRWETGRGFPDVSFLPALAGTLEVSISEIVMGEKFVLKEKEAAEIMETMDRTVTDTLGLSQQELHKNRWRAAAMSGLILLSVLILFCILVLIYETIIQFWSTSDTP